ERALREYRWHPCPASYRDILVFGAVVAQSQLGEKSRLGRYRQRYRMRPEIKRQGAVVDKWIDAVGESIEVDRHERMRICTAANDRTQSQVDRVWGRARHHNVHTTLREEIADPEADLQHPIAFVKPCRPSGASGRMARIDGDCEPTKRRRSIRYSRRPPHPEGELSVLPQRQIPIGRTIQIDRIANSGQLRRGADAVEVRVGRLRHHRDDRRFRHAIEQQRHRTVGFFNEVRRGWPGRGYDYVDPLWTWLETECANSPYRGDGITDKSPLRI